ncbi:MAG: ComF family protein [Chloroflexi bacterium]|nr:MAG: ComF family protein [Chloroflexota bacterium]
MPGLWLEKTGQTLLNFFLPPRCLNCQADGSWLCDSCVRQIDFITTAVCHHCGTPAENGSTFCRQCKNNPLKHIDGIRTAAWFENNPMREAIHQLKYQNHRAVAEPLAQILANTVHHYNLKVDVVAPVPLHSSRLRERGYNQSEILVSWLAKYLQIPANTKSLYRSRKTRSQMTLGAEERRTNVVNAFACKDNRLQNLRVLVVDDVCTTGSTLDACAAALKLQGKAAQVWGLTLAKAQ